MSVARQEHAEADRGSEIDLGRLVTAVDEALESGDMERCFYAWQEMARQERRMRLDDAQRAAIKAVNRRVDDTLSRRVGERIGKTLDRLADERAERRDKWYREVGIHRDFARECARREAFLSC